MEKNMHTSTSRRVVDPDQDFFSKRLKQIIHYSETIDLLFLGYMTLFKINNFRTLKDLTYIFII